MKLKGLFLIFDLWPNKLNPIEMMKDLSKVTFSTLLAVILLFTTNCKKDTPMQEADVVCEVQDPVSNLKWLNDEFKQFLGGPTVNGIVLYDYNGMQVIEVQNSLFSSTNMHTHLCDGSKLLLESPQAMSDYYAKRKEIKVLYGTKLW